MAPTTEKVLSDSCNSRTCFWLGVAVFSSFACYGIRYLYIKYMRSRSNKSTEWRDDDTERHVRLLEEALQRETQAKKEALSRLSRIASEKLRDNNPGIADLSDVNRPTKIGEQMSELYDNEWTEAFSWLENTNGRDEQKYIDLLRDVLLDIYSVCREKATKQLQIFVDPFDDGSEQIGAKKSSNVPLAIKDARKKAVAEVISYVCEGVLRHLSQTPLYNEYLLKQTFQPCQHYVIRCIELCWLMCVQDPPVTLDTSGTGQKFNTSNYRPYTVSGDTIDFIVWPMVRLHDNGPLLCKGVAQAIRR